MYSLFRSVVIIVVVVVAVAVVVAAVVVIAAATAVAAVGLGLTPPFMFCYVCVFWRNPPPLFLKIIKKKKRLIDDLKKLTLPSPQRNEMSIGQIFKFRDPPPPPKKKKKKKKKKVLLCVSNKYNNNRRLQSHVVTRFRSRVFNTDITFEKPNKDR